MRRPDDLPAVCLAALLLLAACGKGPAPEAGSAETEKPGAGPAIIDGTRLVAADREPQNWLMHGRSYDEQRYSPLAQINEQNVAQLGLAWYLDLGTDKGLEATPLVVDGVMYTSSVWNVIHAIDAKTGNLLWRYDPQVQRARLRSACCGATNRGLAAWNGKLYEGLIDGRLIAIDARTGAPIWDVQTTDPEQDYSISGAPRIINGKVIIGNGGAEYGVRGYVTAYDAETGQQAWRFYTVPGDPAKGFESAAMEMAAKTWSGEWWKVGGGGTAWDAFAYDPDMNLLYIGTGNGGPWPREIRSPGGGDNLFLSSIVAVNADTGEYAWHYQTTPGETWDYTATQSIILADLEIDGRLRKVLMQAPKNGFFYVLDRVTGELLSAKNYVPTNWASHVDLATGRPVEIEGSRYTQGAKLITPGPSGGHNWPPMSFSPLTGLVYIPMQESSYLYSMAAEFQPRRGQWNVGNDPDAKPPVGPAPAGPTGALLAWDPVAQSRAWAVDLGGTWNGGTLATAGNLVVQGAADGRIVIYQAQTGDKLWEMPIQTGALAGPISYSVDGEQYIAIAAGWTGAIALWGGNRRLADQGWVESRILAFKLGGSAALPQVPERDPMPAPPPSTASAEVIAQGAKLYAGTCATCHGVNAIAGPMPDLRYMTAEAHSRFIDVVLGGVLAGGGMASFADKFNAEDVEAIHAYVISRANEDDNKQQASP